MRFQTKITSTKVHIGDTSDEIDFSDDESKNFNSTSKIEELPIFTNNIQLQGDDSENTMNAEILEKIPNAEGDALVKKIENFEDEIESVDEDEKKATFAIKGDVNVTSDEISFYENESKIFTDAKIDEKLPNFANENLNEEIEFLEDNSKTNKETKMIEKISCAGRVAGSKMSENLDDEIENNSNKTEGNEIVF